MNIRFNVFRCIRSFDKIFESLSTSEPIKVNNDSQLNIHAHEERRLPSKQGGRPPLSRADREETTITKGGGVLLGAEEREGEGIPVITQRIEEKMVVRSGT